LSGGADIFHTAGKKPRCHGNTGALLSAAGSERYEFEGGDPDAGHNEAQQKDRTMSDEYAVALFAGAQDIDEKNQGCDSSKGKDNDDPARHRCSVEV
jgi:hypothetical protein